MLSLDDLRSPAVALDWHEAVAAAAALGALLVDAEAASCPRAVDVTLLPSGDLRITGPGRVDGSAGAGVAFVLAQLLESSPYPAQLRQLIERYADADGSDADAMRDAASFIVALAFFERPGRREVLAAVALRAEPVIERARRATALEALTERTRQAAAPGPAPVPVAEVPGEGDVAGGDDWNPPQEARPARLILPAAVGLAAFLAVGYLAAVWFDRPPSTPVAARVEEDLPMSGADQPGAATATASPGVPPAPLTPATTLRVRPAAGRVTAPPPASGSTPGLPPASSSPVPAADPGPAPARTIDVVVAEREGRVVSPPIAPVRPTPRAAAADRIFSSGDPQVTPAVLIRPHLPENPAPEVPEEHVGTLEFVVTETGAVERVHLVSPANRYQERMLVAAAKTWQFRPATRDGRPVRYRIRIRATL
jgi:TonB family protein